MRITDYDSVCSEYNRRYEEHDYAGIANALLGFIGPAASGALLEVGCGTGHWLEFLSSRARRIIGVDPSRGMLGRARHDLPDAALVGGRAEVLPFPSESFDRLFCINALHHFSGPPEFLTEARRVLRSRGGLMTVGLDPHTGLDRWWVYDYFPESRALDRERYPSAEEIRRAMAAAGFVRCTTVEAQRNPVTLSGTTVRSRGLLARSFTSQLTILTEAEYARDLERIEEDMQIAAAKGTELLLEADVGLYATTGWWR